MSLPMPDDYTVRLVDMPVSVGGMISECPDGHIDVYINARLSSAGQHTAAFHEWKHWLNGDLDNGRPIREVEREVERDVEPTGRARRQPKLMRARDLMRSQPKPQPKKPLYAPEWKDDIYLKLPYME